LWDDKVIPISRTLEAIEQSEILFREHRCGLWSVTPLHASTLIGFGGLWPFRVPPEMDLLYGVAEAAWGRGYATEIAEAVTTHCFTRLAMPDVRASTDVANLASIRVLEKLGFRLVRRAVVDGLETVFYELTPHGVYL
jgi:RimJ/RimL family protein N-acetyltransferase